MRGAFGAPGCGQIRRRTAERDYAVVDFDDDPAVVVGVPLSWRRISEPMLSLVGASLESAGDGTGCPMARMEGWVSFDLLASVAQPLQNTTLAMITPEAKKKPDTHKSLAHFSKPTWHETVNGARDRT